ncbi:Probable xyloglucan endotransglucosylase/hydrolase protein 27 [Striga hermonthica]|uniref:Probable xyloglucan endotransglucosylase/hydrolase protein 27 n=1 Tax=Striga hermonthica TaxID=68872 RepID=A0A9N7NK47_STRHE|nr:Probable xyloglucan endotransglucosylase/hydrolase protein 27 [Striga hermonthica]
MAIHNLVCFYFVSSLFFLGLSSSDSTPWAPRLVSFHEGFDPLYGKQNVVPYDEANTSAMRVYGTIWDGSSWATEGGRYKVDHRYGPFVAEYSGFVMGGGDWVGLKLGREEQAQMEGFRRRWMTYSYCYDKKRYAVALPECVFEAGEFERLRRFDPWTFGSSSKR